MMYMMHDSLILMLHVPAMQISIRVINLQWGLSEILRFLNALLAACVPAKHTVLNWDVLQAPDFVTPHASMLGVTNLVHW